MQDVLSKIGGFPDVPVNGPAPAQQPLGYRNNMQYAFAQGAPPPKKQEKSAPNSKKGKSNGQTSQSGQTFVGFYSKGSADKLVSVESCLLPSKDALAAYQCAKRILLESGLTAEKGKVCMYVCVYVCMWGMWF